ncbi:hypothetical protein R3P38DRAFT_1761308 [Favolaschia claudopus]|uniref:Uncharacterized protein n=1 Tax=Favolaschia claudopus TaxID=2862362 RepID=A0AAW0DH07_9AGAR
MREYIRGYDPSRASRWTLKARDLGLDCLIQNLLLTFISVNHLHRYSHFLGRLGPLGRSEDLVSYSDYLTIAVSNTSERCATVAALSLITPLLPRLGSISGLLLCLSKVREPPFFVASMWNPCLRTRYSTRRLQRVFTHASSTRTDTQIDYTPADDGPTNNKLRHCLEKQSLPSSNPPQSRSCFVHRLSKFWPFASSLRL